MMQALSIQQHHDAITGTHGANVANDYRRMMKDSKKAALNT